MLTTCSVPSFRRVQDEHGKNKKNNVTSRYAETYTTINCKRSTVLQRLIQTASGRCPGGIRTAPGGVRTAFSRTPMLS